MASKYIVDTHALIWFFGNNPKLGSEAAKILQDPMADLILPAIVFAEACWVVQSGKSNLSIEDLLQAIDSNPQCSIFPLNREIIEESVKLSSLGEMHDRLIVATALILEKKGYGIGLVTKDKEIKDSGLVRTIW